MFLDETRKITDKKEFVNAKSIKLAHILITYSAMK